MKYRPMFSVSQLLLNFMNVPILNFSLIICHSRSLPVIAKRTVAKYTLNLPSRWQSHTFVNVLYTNNLLKIQHIDIIQFIALILHVVWNRCNDNLFQSHFLLQSNKSNLLNCIFTHVSKYIWSDQKNLLFVKYDRNTWKTIYSEHFLSLSLKILNEIRQMQYHHPVIPSSSYRNPMLSMLIYHLEQKTAIDFPTTSIISRDVVATMHHATDRLYKQAGRRLITGLRCYLAVYYIPTSRKFQSSCGWKHRTE